MKYIALEEFCNYHGVEVKLIREFADFGLIPLHIQEDQVFLPAKAINRTERMLRLFRDLEVNKEGIAVILHMRKQLKKLHRHHEKLLDRLRQLENLALTGPPNPRHYIIQEINVD